MRQILIASKKPSTMVDIRASTIVDCNGDTIMQTIPVLWKSNCKNAQHTTYNTNRGLDQDVNQIAPWSKLERQHQQYHDDDSCLYNLFDQDLGSSWWWNKAPTQASAKMSSFLSNCLDWETEIRSLFHTLLIPFQTIHEDGRFTKYQRFGCISMRYASYAINVHENVEVTWSHGIFITWSVEYSALTT